MENGVENGTNGACAVGSPPIEKVKGCGAKFCTYDPEEARAPDPETDIRHIRNTVLCPLKLCHSIEEHNRNTNK